MFNFYYRLVFSKIEKKVVVTKFVVYEQILKKINFLTCIFAYTDDFIYYTELVNNSF